MKKMIFLFLIINTILISYILQNNISNDITVGTFTIEQELKSIEDYNYMNYNKYIKYIEENPNASYEEAIVMVNNNIDISYNKDLSKIVHHKYFIRNNLDNYLINLTDNLDETISLVNTNSIYEQYTNTTLTDITKDTLILVNKYHYLNSNYEPDDLEEINTIYNKGNNNKLRTIAKEAFEKMCAAALLDNIHLYNMSAYRSFEYQENIYNKNVLSDGQNEADKTSARPGYSEHQSGLTLDINWISNKFEDTDEFKWLEKHAYEYGFILRYPKNKENLTGYSYEPWHYRYVGEEVANKIKEDNITFDEYYAYYIEK